MLPSVLRPPSIRFQASFDLTPTMPRHHQSPWDTLAKQRHREILRNSVYRSSGNVAVLLDGEDLAGTRTLSTSQAFSEIWVINSGVHANVSYMRQQAGRIMTTHPELTHQGPSSTWQD